MVQPAYAKSNLVDVLDHVIEVHSDYAVVDVENKTAVLSGNLAITQGNRQAKAQTATINFDQRSGELQGNIVMSEPNLQLQSKRLAFSSGQQITATQARATIIDKRARTTGDSISRNTDGVININQATYTVCDPENETWKIHASHIKLNIDKGYGEARNTRLKIANIPVLYFPYLRFPVGDQRQSGLLFPSVNFGSDNGLDIVQPFYWNIGPNKDLTVAPRWIQDRGVGLEFNGRLLTKHTFTQIDGSYLFNDDITDDRRWAGEIQHSGKWGKGVIRQGEFRTQVSIKRASDLDFFEEVGSTQAEGDEASTYLTQSASIGYKTPIKKGGELSIGGGYQTIQRIQFLDGEQFQILPSAFVNLSLPLTRTLSFEAQQSYHRFEHADELQPQGQRQRLDYHLQYSTQRPWGFLKARAGIKNLLYQFETSDVATIQDAQVNVSVASVDSGLVFERATNKLLQTFEPRLYYVFSEFEEQQQLPVFDTSESTLTYQQLFRDDRFNGFDRIGDTNQLTFGVTSRFINKNNGREIASFKIGQSFFFEDRQVAIIETTPRLENEFSELILQADIDVNRYWRFSGRANFSYSTDNQPFQLEEGDFRLTYRGQSESSQPLIVTASFGFEREDVLFNERIEQAEMAFYLPLVKQWQLFGRVQYDFFGRRSLNNLGGFRYQNCCWNVDVMYFQRVEVNASNLLDNRLDRGFELRFELKGLGGVGKSIETILERNIFGYTARSKY